MTKQTTKKISTRPGGAAVVVLIRHGAVEAPAEALLGRSRGFHLAGGGLEQARALARRFASAEVETVWSSPLERARETATLLAKHLKKPLTIDARLNEINYGVWSGRALPDLALETSWKEYIASAYRSEIPGGESMAVAQTRILSFLDDLAQPNRRGLHLAVTHAEPIRLALAAVISARGFLQTKVEISLASATAIKLSKPPLVLAVNDISHLGGWRYGQRA